MDGSSKGVDPRIVREINLNRIFSALRIRGASTITEIVREIHLSPATVKSVLVDLERYGLICESGEGSSTGGRKPRLYSLNSKQNFVCGVELHTHFFIIAMVTLNGIIFSTKKRQLDITSPDKIADTICSSFQTLCEEQEIDPLKILGLGITQPGIVDSGGKKIRFDVHHGWTEVPLGSLVQQKLPVPVYLVEDANSKLTAEIEFGEFGEKDNVLYVQIGTSGESGISGGLVINGEIHSGLHGFAGEIGHMVIDPKGPECYCGRRGCWEAISDIYPLLEKINTWYPEQKLNQIDHFFRIVLDKYETDFKIKKMLDWYIDIQAEGITNLVHILNPGKIIIGGKITLLGDMFLERIRTRVHQKAMKPFLEEIQISLSSIEEESGILGAASTVLQHAVFLRQQQLGA